MKVSTKTIVGLMNVDFISDEICKVIPITPYTILPKRRGRKKKNDDSPNINSHLVDGNVITVDPGHTLYGVRLKPKKKKQEQKKFRNSVTVVMYLDEKLINFKVSANGTFQFTGCKYNKQAERCMQIFWSYIEEHTDFYTLRGENVEIILVPAMRNIDYNLGFLVDREKLANYINHETDYIAILDLLFGYTGVNIKFPMTHDVRTIELKKFVRGTEFDEWEETTADYKEYLERLSPKDQAKKLNQDRYNTFLVFQSGKCIMSGICTAFMEQEFYKFIDIIQKCRLQIMERSDEQVEYNIHKVEDSAVDGLIETHIDEIEEHFLFNISIIKDDDATTEIYYISQEPLTLNELKEPESQPLGYIEFTVLDYSKTIIVNYVQALEPGCGVGTFMMLCGLYCAALKHGSITIELDDMTDRIRTENNIYTKLGLKYRTDSGPEMIGKIDDTLNKFGITPPYRPKQKKHTGDLASVFPGGKAIVEKACVIKN